MKKFVDQLVPDTYYHIYNRACGFDKIFLEDKNYYFFMDLFKERLLGYVDLYCYCLIPNHFHMLIKTKQVLHMASETINYSKIFGNFFAAYAQSFNFYYHRKGSLFSQNFRRKMIENDEYLRTVVVYIHRNPLKHGLVEDLSEWKFSSYLEYINGLPRYCNKPDVLQWFSSKDLFKFCHTLDPNSDIE
jgi:REP element-mobilizing transposase RayT